MRKPLMLGMMTVVVGLGVMLWANVREGKQFVLPTQREELQKQLPEAPTTLEEAEKVKANTLLESPRFTGRSADGATYTLEAARADQVGNVSDSLVVLYEVKAHYMGAENKELTATATQGNYAQTKDELMLSEATLRYDTLTMKTPDVLINLKNKLAKGNFLHLEMASKNGGKVTTLAGDKFEVDQDTGRVMVRGNVKVRMP